MELRRQIAINNTLKSNSDENNTKKNINSFININPNPTYGMLNIRVNSSENYEGEILVLDMLGKTILQKNIIHTETKIDLSDYPKGFYLIKVTNDNESKTEKIIYQ